MTDRRETRAVLVPIGAGVLAIAVLVAIAAILGLLSGAQP